ncbi:MAG: helix-turn-helix domain-containing protein [Myxococcota bacterium]
MDEALDQISRRVRRWREEQGLSLQELAGRSDVAASTIQKIETGQMVPSVAVLLKVARGLGRRPAEVVGEERDENDVVLLRAKQHPTIARGSKVKAERLSGDLFDPAIELWRFHLQPGRGSGKDQYAYDGEEVVICEEGQVTCRVDGEDHVLEAGDTLHFKAALPHRWWNSGDVPARFIVAGSYPKGLRSKLHRQVQGRR